MLLLEHLFSSGGQDQAGEGHSRAFETFHLSKAFSFVRTRPIVEDQVVHAMACRRLTIIS